MVSEDPPRAQRRPPVQARAQKTIEIIFEATAKVLINEGEARLTTNRIAERAGVSIGTLYQYFATREEIVAAIVERDRSIAMAELESLLSERDSAEKDPREIVAEFVRLFVKAFGGEDGAPRAFVRLAWQDSSGDAFLHSLREAGERLAIYLHHFRHPALRTQTPALVFVLTRALSGVVRAAVLERTPLIDTEDLQKEMARICWALLAKRR